MENPMFTLTENARKELDAFFADKPKSGIRMYLAPGGCSGPRIGLALDDPNEHDFVVEQDGYTWPVLVELNDRLNLWIKYNIGNAAGGIFIIDPATKKILAIGPSTEEIEALVKEYCE
jgi:Fe-S cluster assembly iron-binding protein IscA